MRGTTGGATGTAGTVGSRRWRRGLWVLLCMLSAPVLAAHDCPDCATDPLPDPEGWVRDTDGAMVVEIEDDGGLYRVPLDCDPWTGNQRLKWIDRTHYKFSRGLCWPTQWLDGVFGDADDQARKTGGTTVRVVVQEHAREAEGVEGDVRFRVRAHLPALEHRLSLVFSSDRDFSDDNAGLNTIEDITPTGDRNRARAGLRWVARQASNMDLDFDVGLQSRLKLYSRVRYRFFAPISENWSWRVTETVDWRDERGFRSRSVVDFDRPMGRHQLLRFSSFAETSRERDRDGIGWAWQQSAALARELNQRAAIRYLVSADGHTEPTTRVDNYRVGATYRRNIWRPWVFFELEPYVAWPRERRYDTTFGGVVRVETLFGIR